MIRKIVLFIAVLLCYVSLIYSDETIAIVVNKNMKIDNISLSDLRRIFLGEKNEWNDGQKIFAINLSPENEARIKFQNVIIGMSADELQKFWNDEKIKGKTFTQPNVQKSTAAIKAFIKKLPNAISYLPLKEVDNEMKVLKIDSLGPSDEKYILK